MSFLDHPEFIFQKNAYFAAANTHRGFVSYFSPLFDAYPKYVIKGGPGCGKSTLMKKIAKAAEKKGLAVTYYFCSSDTDSLDAVAIPERGIVVLDGTPPHAVEPKYPGAFDRLIDLTAFWDHTILQSNVNEIAALSGEIQKNYQKVYALMQAIVSLENVIDTATASAFDHDHAAKIITRLLEKRHTEEAKKPSITYRPASAFGVKGYLHFNSYETSAETIYQIKDRIVYSEYFFKQLQKLLTQKKISYILSPRPLDEKTESIYLPKERILFTRLTCCQETSGMINLDRLLPSRGKGALLGHKSLLREIDTLCLNIQKILHRIGQAHDELESYYITATDYLALNQFSEQFISSLFTV